MPCRLLITWMSTLTNHELNWMNLLALRFAWDHCCSFLFSLIFTSLLATNYMLVSLDGNKENRIKFYSFPEREWPLSFFFLHTNMADEASCENGWYQNHVISLKVVLIVSPNSSRRSTEELLCYLYFNTWIQLNFVAWRECVVNGAQWVNIPRCGRKWHWKRYRWIIWWACHIKGVRHGSPS